MLPLLVLAGTAKHATRLITAYAWRYRADADDADDDFRISLAGAQEKDAFLWWDGK